MNDDTNYEQFVRLFVQHEPELLRTALVYVPCRSDARDVVQETAVALWKQFDEYESDRPFVPWATAFVRIEVKRYLRAVRRKSLLSERAVEVLTTAESTVTEELEARYRALRHCLEQLPQDRRALIRGYYFDGQDVLSLASEHRRTVDAVYKMLQRIRRGLMKCIEGHLAEV